MLTGHEPRVLSNVYVLVASDSMLNGSSKYVQCGISWLEGLGGETLLRQRSVYTFLMCLSHPTLSNQLVSILY